MVNPILQQDDDVELLALQSVDDDFLFMSGPNGINDCCAPAEIRFDAHYDDSSEGIRVIAYLERLSSANLSGANCSFAISSVSPTTWAETSLYTASGTEQPSGAFTASVTSANLGGLQLDGEAIIAVLVTVSRLRRTYTKKFYVNHIGIFDTVERLRRRVNTHEILQTDSQESIIHHIS